MSMPDAEAPIVVGVSAETGSGAALRWAVAEAARRETRVVAILAWRPTRPPAAPGGKPPAVSATPSAHAAAAAQHTLETLVTMALGSVHEVECRAVHGKPVDALVEASRTAQLIVLDAPRPGRAAKLRTSLLAPQLVYAASCPVVVIPPDRPARPRASKAKKAAQRAVASAARAGRAGIRPPAG